MEMTPPLPIFPDLTKPGVVASWREKFEKGVLSCTHFKEHWRLWVPKLLSPDPNGNCLEWNFDEERTQKILFDSLEEFICNGDPQEVRTYNFTHLSDTTWQLIKKNQAKGQK